MGRLGACPRGCGRDGLLYQGRRQTLHCKSNVLVSPHAPPHPESFEEPALGETPPYILGNAARPSALDSRCTPGPLPSGNYTCNAASPFIPLRVSRAEQARGRALARAHPARRRLHAVVGPHPPRPYRVSLSMTASASISTSQSGSMNRDTCMMVFAGRIEAKNSPCTEATAC